MSEAQELRDSIATLERRRARAARIGWLLEHSGRPRPNLADRLDWLDGVHDKISNEIGRLERQLDPLAMHYELQCMARGLNFSER